VVYLFNYFQFSSVQFSSVQFTRREASSAVAGLVVSLQLLVPERFTE